MTDRRIVKSEKAIQSAFLAMLLDVGFDAITVKNLTEKADISRKTFYLHYLDKYDLLNGIVDEMIRDLTDLCEKKKDMGFVDGTVLWFYYFEEHKPFFTALFSTESTISFRHRLLDFIMEQLNNKLEGGLGTQGIPKSCVNLWQWPYLGLLNPMYWINFMLGLKK